MKQRRGPIVLSFAALLATGCGTKPATLPIAPAPLPNLTGNWQIQLAASASVAFPSGVVLFGALQNTGAQVSGTFRFSNLAQFGLGGCTLNQVVSVTGKLDAAGDLTLTSAALNDGSVVTVQLLLPAVLTGFAKGTIAVAGKACALASAPAIGVEIASVSGTFTGALTPVTVVAPAGPAGSAILTLTQAAIPAADGQFPVTGSLAYTFGTCTGTTALSGDVSGAGLTLTATPAAQELLPNVRLNGAVVPTASSVNVSELLFADFPCAVNPPAIVAYTGTWARQ